MKQFNTKNLRNVEGRNLRRILKRLSASERALLAADLETGAIHLDKLSRAQSTALLEVAGSYVESARKASPDERRQIAAGRIGLSRLHNRHRHEPTSDAQIERLFVKLGPERVSRVLDRIIDRLTAPGLQAAE